MNIIYIEDFKYLKTTISICGNFTNLYYKDEYITCCEYKHLGELFNKFIHAALGHTKNYSFSQIQIKNVIYIKCPNRWNMKGLYIL